MHRFVACFADLTDCRASNARRHDFHEMLIILRNRLLRRLALNLAKLEGSKGSTKGKLKRAGWNDEFLGSLLAQFAKCHMR